MDAFTRRLEKEVERVKCIEEWRREYMTLMMRDMENIELGREQGLRALTVSLKGILNDFEKVYQAVINNEAYKTISREQVMKYYKQNRT